MNWLLLGNDPKGISFGVEKQIVGEKAEVINIGQFLHPSNEKDGVDGEKLPLRCSVQNKRG